MAAPSIFSPFVVAPTRPTTGRSNSASSSYSSSNDSFLGRTLDHTLDDDNDHHGDDDNIASDYYAIPHNLTSFLERRPLAWRTGLPLSAGGLDLNLLHSKNLSPSSPSPPSHHTHSRGRRARDSVERLRYDMTDFVKATVWANHDTVRLRPSVCGQHNGEAAVKGVFVDCALPHWLRPTQGEHLHVHADGSAHMILSLADAATAVECGWAERLPLPLLEDLDDDHTTVQYVSVHAPRCASELADWKRLVLASVRFCTYTSRDLSIRRPERL